MRAHINRLLMSFVIVIVVVSLWSTSYGIEEPLGRERLKGVGLFRLECPEWYIDLDQAGYSDWWFCKIVPGWHCVSYTHEVLSGEWAAAIYYHGILNGGGDPTAPAGTAVWLTDSYICPSWTTNTSFTQVSVAAWDNPANPSGTGKNDEARTVITNGQVNIKIEYEIADLGVVFASPLGVIADPATGAFARSGRYVLLQTYTIMNISGAPLDSMEFYQMLHAHPADTYSPIVISVYDSDPYPDPVLAAYVPFNPKHTVGNFRYDITQWNNAPLDIGKSWLDWIGFSCTVEPNAIPSRSAVGNNLFSGHEGKPPAPGTHWNIESRTLNGLTTIGPNDVAGAETWYFGSLAPDDSVSLTVVLMAGQMDCNKNGVPDLCDIDGGYSDDTNLNGIPDECEWPTEVGLSTLDAFRYDGHVEVVWTTISEVSNGGFNIHRSLNEDGLRARINDELIPARGSELQGASYSFIDGDVVDGFGYYYWLESVDLSGAGTIHAPVLASAAGESPVPSAFGLEQNHPNPFNPITEIKYSLPVDCYVTLEVYDILGRRVATLVNDYQTAGFKSVHWQVDSEFSSGVYFYKLQAGSYIETRKMVLLR